MKLDENMAYTGIAHRVRLSPGLGFDIKPTKRLSVYGEFSNLLHLTFRNFSAGIKYDIGKVTR